MSNRSSHDELPTRSTTNTPTFLENCVLYADYKAMGIYLVNNPVQQDNLDRCLLRGLQMVQQNERNMSLLAPVLTILLQSGAKWNNNALLAEQKTPLHIICKARDDHHELLDLFIKSSQPTIINTHDIQTALMYAVNSVNINCVNNC